MPTARRRGAAWPTLRPTLVALMVFLTAGAKAWAAPNDDRGGAIAALFIAPALMLVSWSYQVAVAALFPGFVRRAQVAVERHWPITALWGFGGLCLLGLVMGILSQGGKPGQALAGVAAAPALLFAGLGSTGISCAVGTWVFRRRQEEPHLVVVVLAGAAIWGWATLVPIAGALLALAGLFLSLGAAIQVALNWSRLGDELQPPISAPAVGPPPAPTPPAAPAEPENVEQQGW